VTAFESFRLEELSELPPDLPGIADEQPQAFWALSNGKGWRLGLGQNSDEAEPAILASPSGVLFVGLYHGTTASVHPDDGRILDRVKLMGKVVFWTDYGELVLATGELEAAVFDSSGRLLCKAGLADVLDSAEISDGILRLHDMSGRSGSFDARSGRPVKDDSLDKPAD